MIGQVVLGIAIVLLGVRILGWALPDGNVADRIFEPLLKDRYKWIVDVFLAGVVGYGLYFWYSGRVWCRFACPLAALMHIYARFSRFRILAEKKKCISCNVCTSVCHQGIDVMNFANKGLPMADPECVRCSACVQSCPTGTLTFGQVNPATGLVIRRDRLAASPVLMAEVGHGKPGPVP
jgi:NosR/NirI family nitrous oxide reductase transcriptional regulator